MKHSKSIFAVVLLVLIFSSCNKDNPQPSSQGGSNSGNSSGSNSGNNTGGNTGNSQPTYTAVNVSINNSIYHQLCPDWYLGDDDFGGYIGITGSVKLIIADNSTKVYADVSAEYDEYSSTGNTRARIDGNADANKILLYTAPAGKKVYSINSSSSYTFSWYPPADFHGTGVSSPGTFIYKIEIIGDTSGPDLPCDGSTERSRFRIWFDDFNVTITDK